MKKRMFLASEIDQVAEHIVPKLGKLVDQIKAVFVPTAGEVEEDKSWIDVNRDGLNKAGVKTFDYTLTGKTEADLEKDLGGCDWIHVNGGNPFYLLLQMRKSGFDKFIRRQLDKGVIYTGSSSGSIVMAPDIEVTACFDMNIYGEELKTFNGLSLVDFLILPHWGSDDFRDIYLDQKMEIAYKKGNKIILLNDDQYVEVIGEDYKIVDVTTDG